MSGRGAQREDFVAPSGGPATAKGLWTRLNSHASGRRSGDQFNIYICDRFIVPALTPGQQRDIGEGRLLLDQMTRSFIREHLSYRFVVHRDGAQALAVERAVRAGGLPAGQPYLNPLTDSRPASRRRANRCRAAPAIRQQGAPIHGHEDREARADS
jgi:hypothetical protein